MAGHELCHAALAVADQGTMPERIIEAATPRATPVVGAMVTLESLRVWHRMLNETSVKGS